MEFIDRIKDKARKLQNRIVLPEGTEIRTLKAAEIVLRDQLAKIILLGDPVKIKEITDKEGIDISGAVIIDPKVSPMRTHYAEMMVEIRKRQRIDNAGSAGVIE